MWCSVRIVRTVHVVQCACCEKSACGAVCVLLGECMWCSVRIVRRVHVMQRACCELSASGAACYKALIISYL